MSKTNVVNVKVNNIRPKYQNLKEWTDDQNNVYIGRGGIVFIDGKRFPKEDSLWANPCKIDDKNDRKKVIQLYEQYIREKIKKENLNEQLLKLKGKNLGCWCKPDACHGDVLVKLIAEIDN
jgi:hypothetical protein